MRSLISSIDSISERVGKLFAWSSTLLVLLISLDVAMRYLFDFTLIWIIELEIYFFALLFIMGSAYAFKHDKHVRVDVFYSQFSVKKKAWTNLIGGLLFLLPWTIAVVLITGRYALYSFKIREASPQPGGLAALYILKFFVVIGFFLLFLQALSSIFKSYLIIVNRPYQEEIEDGSTINEGL